MAYAYQGRAGFGFSLLVTWNSYTTKQLRNKAIFSLKQYCMHCYVVLINHVICDCGILFLNIITCSYLLKVCLCLVGVGDIEIFYITIYSEKILRYYYIIMIFFSIFITLSYILLFWTRRFQTWMIFYLKLKSKYGPLLGTNFMKN